MPELPEVETVRRGLAPAMEGRLIARAEIRRDGLRWPFPPDMGRRLQGQRVLRLRRRGKYILCDLQSGETLLIHLGMSGRMLIDGGQSAPTQRPLPAPGRHDHVLLHMEGGGSGDGTGRRVTFNDARRFGMMDLWPTERLDEHRLLAGLGPEPLGNGFSARWLHDGLKRRRGPVKTALLDQRLVAGLGNIYVCEALWRARIRPTRRSCSLSAPRVARLVPVIREVLEEAIAAGGSSLRDHRRTDGALGYFQHGFAVYGRAGKPCKTPGCNGKIARTVQSGRSSFHCRQCQR